MLFSIYCRSVSGLVDTYRGYRISQDLLMESLTMKLTNKKIHLSVSECLFILIDRFDKIQNKLEICRNENKKLNLQKDEHICVFSRSRGMLTDWLYQEHNHDLFEFLKVCYTSSDKCKSSYRILIQS